MMSESIIIKKKCLEKLFLRVQQFDRINDRQETIWLSSLVPVCLMYIEHWTHCVFKFFLVGYPDWDPPRSLSFSPAYAFSHYRNVHLYQSGNLIHERKFSLVKNSRVDFTFLANAIGDLGNSSAHVGIKQKSSSDSRGNFEKDTTIPNLSSLEEDILTLLLSSPNLYGLEIIEAFESATDSKLPIGSLYPTLHKLHKKGLVESSWGEDKPEERGGARRKYYCITGSGIRALKQIRDRRSSLSNWNFITT